jgi:translation initiation factor 1A|mmetsp:Transcript_86091/g.125965  ORF Transcript_86091/g.125965 Transcript_86091/m.125965 type:complete len:151 (+) Transcript_86091:27-479(+)
MKNKSRSDKKKKKNSQDGREKRELIFKQKDQEYAQILKMLGNGRCDTYCFDGIRRLCHIRGKMRKRIWINVGDIVLIGKREFQDRKGDIIQKYFPDEAKNLKDYGELPRNIFISEMILAKEGDSNKICSDQAFEFDSTSEKDVAKSKYIL